MSDPFKPGEFVTNGVTVFMVYEGERTRWTKRLEPGRIWVARRGDDFHMGLVTRAVSELRRATCDEVFESCPHGKVLSSWPCEECKEKGIEQW